jgi:hypothetical protein
LQSLIPLSSARSIPTNFGFVFQAGPIQVADTIITETTTTEAPLPTNTSPIAITRTELDDTVASSIPTHEPAPKRKRLVREEEDDQAWFQKRKRKTPKEEHAEHTLPAETTQVAVDEPHQEPPIEKESTKRKVVRKRVLVPRSRKKAPTESHSEPPKDEPIPLIEPEVEALPPPKEKTKTKAPAVVVKRKPEQPATLDAPLPVQKTEEQPSTHSLQPTTDPVPLKKTKLTRRLRDEKTADKPAEKTLEQGIVTAPVEAQPDLEHGTTEPPKKKKVVRRVRVPKISATTRAMPTTDVCNADDTKPSALAEHVPLNLPETTVPAPATKKATKAPKRIYFNDDSDIDLDQMLSSIAAMTGPKTATKTTTSKSGRVARKKVAS